jgi:hypothetical protein
MITVAKKKLAVCALIAGILTTSCEKLPEIQFDDILLVVSSKPEYEVVMGMKESVYVVDGKFQDLVEGECIDFHKNKSIFSIGQLLVKNPILKSGRAVVAARRQQLLFKKHRSSLYDPNLSL